MAELKTKGSVARIICHEFQPENGAKQIELAEKEYEPYHFGNTDHPIDYWGAIVHLVRLTIGTGILVLPFAFHNVGYGIAILGSIFIGLLYVNNVHALLFTEYHLCRKLRVSNLTFVGVVEKTFENGPVSVKKVGPYFKYLLYFYYGIPTGNAIYLIIIADNMSQIYKYYFQSNYYDLQLAISIVVVPIILLCLIPKLKFLVPLSILTNVFTVVNIGIIFVYSSNFGRWKHNAKLIGDVHYIPQFFAIVLQSLIATGMILPLKNDMKDPKNFASPFGVLNVSFTALIALYVTFGLVGSLNYGNAVQHNILSNLPPGHLITTSVQILYTLALCVTYTLLFYVYFDTIWSNVLKQKVSGTSYERLCKYALRICVNVAAYLMAILVPNFALFTSIVGTVGIILEIGLPSVLQLTIMAKSKCKPSIFRYYLFKNLMMILLSLVMFVMSLRTCILDIIHLYDL